MLRIQSQLYQTHVFQIQKFMNYHLELYLIYQQHVYVMIKLFIYIYLITFLYMRIIVNDNDYYLHNKIIMILI